MSISVKISGLKELEAALLDLEKAATRKTVARNALKKGAAPIASAMAAGARRTPQPEIGANIAVSTKIVGEAGNAAFHAAMKQGFDKASAVKAMRDARRAAKGTLPPVLMYVGPTDGHSMAHWWEFGIAPHVNGGQFAGTKHPGVRPTPFMRPAFDGQKDAALAAIAAELAAQIQKAAARQAKRKAKGA